MNEKTCLDSLFSTIITLYALFLLYFPPFLFLKTLNFSPILISTIVLLLYLLRLGRKTHKSDTLGLTKPNSSEIDRNQIAESEPDSNSNSFYAESFVEWDVRAPLEVIYEEYEGEEADENDAVSEENRETQMNVIRRYASLSMYYPETDSDTSSEGDFPIIGEWESPPEKTSFRWEDEDDREGLIEIALDIDQQKRRISRDREIDEDNLIEIDLSPAR